MADETPKPPVVDPPKPDTRDEEITKLKAQIAELDKQILAEKDKAKHGGGEQKPAASETTLQALVESQRELKETLKTMQNQKKKWVPWAVGL